MFLNWKIGFITKKSKKESSLVAHSRQKAILFADISGSSALYKNVGNQTAKQIIDDLLRAMSQLVVENKGKVIKSIGDEIMTSFYDSRNCLFSAIAMQLRFKQVFMTHGLTLSIGIGFGDVITEQQDLFGEAVNDAAYLTSLAKGGQILITQDVYDQLDDVTKVNAREFDKVKIKGSKDTSVVYRVFWQQGITRDKETRLMSSESIANELKSSVIQIKHAGELYLLTSEQLPFLIGRDPQKCHLLLDKNQVSREHCQITFSRGKFVLVDQSTNGCYIATQGKNELYIRREEFPLIESTTLSLGLPVEQAPKEVIEIIL